jgi:alkylation response protein AidB-like acyl-CoA dehydrogenase
MDTTIEAVQIHGGNGYVAAEYQRWCAMLNYKYMRERQIQRIVISRTFSLASRKIID